MHRTVMRYKVDKMAKSVDNLETVSELLARFDIRANKLSRTPQNSELSAEAFGSGKKSTLVTATE
jgi:hypothetical protein